LIEGMSLPADAGSIECEEASGCVTTRSTTLSFDFPFCFL
jgi:hypothetical protein